MAETGTDGDEVIAAAREAVDRLEAAAEDLAEAERAVEERGEARLERIADAYREAESLLDEYQDTATGTGGEEFMGYVQFQEDFSSFVEGLDDDLPHRDAFEAALNAVDKRRLSESDFRSARRELAPAREAAELLDERSEARERYRERRRDLRRRRDDLESAIEDCERLLELGEADLSAPVETLREPIAAYDDAVREDFRAFRRAASAREVLDAVERASEYPLVDLRSPPDELTSYVREYEAGTETIPDLLEYADYSRSKLDHYVEAPGELKRRVATRQTYLERLDGSAFTLAWPPAPADELRYRCEELVPAIATFADDETVRKLHEVRDLAREDRYERLRTAAVARDELSETERERLESGAVERRRERLAEARERIDRALEDHPER